MRKILYFYISLYFVIYIVKINALYIQNVKENNDNYKSLDNKNDRKLKNYSFNKNITESSPNKIDDLKNTENQLSLSINENDKNKVKNSTVVENKNDNNQNMRKKEKEKKKHFDKSFTVNKIKNNDEDSIKQDNQKVDSPYENFKMNDNKNENYSFLKDKRIICMCILCLVGSIYISHKYEENIFVILKKKLFSENNNNNCIKYTQNYNTKESLTSTPTNIHTSTSTNIYTSTSTNIHTSTSTNIHMSTSMNILPSKSTNVFPSKSTNILPSTSTNILPSTSTNAHNMKFFNMNKFIIIDNGNTKSKIIDNQDRNININKMAKVRSLKPRPPSHYEIFNNQDISISEDQDASVFEDQDTNVFEDQDDSVFEDQDTNVFEDQDNSVFEDQDTNVFEDQNDSVFEDTNNNMPSCSEKPNYQNTVEKTVKYNADNNKNKSNSYILNVTNETESLISNSSSSSYYDNNNQTLDDELKRVSRNTFGRSKGEGISLRLSSIYSFSLSENEESIEIRVSNASPQECVIQINSDN